MYEKKIILPKPINLGFSSRPFLRIGLHFLKMYLANADIEYSTSTKQAHFKVFKNNFESSYNYPKCIPCPSLYVRKRMECN
jgi:hypothetical protein